MKIENASEKDLWRICRIRETDPYDQGGMSIEEGCCSDCKYFHSLSGDVGESWGICFSPYGTRSGLLTALYTGCKYKEV